MPTPPQGEGGNSGVSVVGVAIAAVALARFLQKSDPALKGFLQDALRSAETSGVHAADLSFMRTLISGLGGGDDKPFSDRR